MWYLMVDYCRWYILAFLLAFNTTWISRKVLESLTSPSLAPVDETVLIALTAT